MKDRPIVEGTKCPKAAAISSNYLQKLGKTDFEGRHFLVKWLIAATIIQQQLLRSESSNNILTVSYYFILTTSSTL